MKLEDVPDNTMFMDGAGRTFLRLRQCIYARELISAFYDAGNKQVVCISVEGIDHTGFELFLVSASAEVTPYAP